MKKLALAVLVVSTMSCGEDNVGNNTNNRANNGSDLGNNSNNGNNANNANNSNNANNANNSNNANNMSDMGNNNVFNPDMTQQEFCDGEGPPVIFDSTNTGVCTGDIAAVTFRYALCSCESIDMSNEILTDSFDSTMGPYMPPGQSGGSVGTNAIYNHTNKATIGGSLIVGGMGLSDLSNEYDIAADLRVADSFESTGLLNVGNDAYYGGDVNVSSYNVVGTHYQTPGRDYNVGNSSNVGTISRVPVTVPPPCDCAEADLLDIANYVTPYASRNDNDAIQLDPAALTNVGERTTLDLTCGRFYLNEITGNSEILITAQDRTALFIGGNIDVSGKFTIQLEPGAELDIFVAGTFNSSNEVDFGSADNPANVRMYIGGEGESRWNNKFSIGGNIYAPKTDLTTTNDTEIFGSLFVNSLRATNKLTIHYDTAILQAGEMCPDPQIPNGNLDMGMDGGMSDMGDTPETCNDCRDCNNQACNDGVCGMCQTTADCCSPLFCVQGQCVAVIN